MAAPPYRPLFRQGRAPAELVVQLALGAGWPWESVTLPLVLVAEGATGS